MDSSSSARFRRFAVQEKTENELTEAALIDNYVQFVDQIGYSEGTDVLRITALVVVVLLVVLVWLAHKRVFSMVRKLQPLPLTVSSSRPYDTDPLLNIPPELMKQPIENSICLE